MRAIPRSLRWRNASLLALTLAALIAPPARAETLFDGRSFERLAACRQRRRSRSSIGRCGPCPAPASSASSTTRAAPTRTSSCTLQFRRRRPRQQRRPPALPEAERALLVDRLRLRGPDQRQPGAGSAQDRLDLRLHGPRRDAGARRSRRTAGRGCDPASMARRYTVYRDGMRINRYTGARRRSRLHRPAGPRRPSGRRRVPGHPDPRALSSSQMIGSPLGRPSAPSSARTDASASRRIGAEA